MADVDIDSYGEHKSRPEEPTDEHIPLDLVTQEDQLGIPGGFQAPRAHGNRNMNRKHHSEVQDVQVYFTRNT